MAPPSYMWSVVDRNVIRRLLAYMYSVYGFAI